MASYQKFYNGSDGTLEPGKDALYTGSVLSAGSLGGTTSIQTANQMVEVSNLLNTGMKVAEVSTIQAEVLEMIPKQHLKEIASLTKLTGSEVTMHAPMIEPSGFTQQGWSEQNREDAERQLIAVMARAHDMSPNKPMPVTIHSSAVPGTETMPADLIKNITPEEKEQYGYNIPVQVIAVNQETGEPTALRREEKYDMTGKKEIWLPEHQIDSINHTKWIKDLTNLEFYKKSADESLAQGSGDIQRPQLFLNDVQTSLRSIFEKASKFGDDETKEKLKDISKEWATFAETEKSRKLNTMEMLQRRSDLIGDTIHQLASLPGVQIFKPMEEFATEKASETFSNVAVESYKKFGNNAPIISIENPPYGTAISTGEDLKRLIEETREKFAKKISREEGISNSEAAKIAEKMIGATWDTSHISMMRKQGFGKEELVKQAETIAPFVKHVHFNDNLGFTHTDLPPGMGDVPLKEIMKNLEKGSKDKKFIFEGGNFYQHFKTSPQPMILEAMGSPVYSMQAGPTWKNVYGTMGTYSSGYGPFLPPQHFSIYGGGFAGLPQELGGQVANKGSGFSGAPMA